MFLLQLPKNPQDLCSLTIGKSGESNLLLFAQSNFIRKGKGGEKQTNRRTGKQKNRQDKHPKLKKKLEIIFNPISPQF